MRRFLDMTDPVLRVRASMPVHPPVKPRPAGWWVVAGGIALVMAFIAIQTIRDGAHPSGYRGRHWEGQWPYPTEEIETWLSIMAAEGLALCLLLRARGDAALGSARCSWRSGGRPGASARQAAGGRMRNRLAVYCRRRRVLLASRRWRLSRWFRSVTR